MTWHAEIEARRVAKGFTMNQLCQAAGVTLRHYHRLLVEESQPRQRTIVRLQLALCLLERMGERALNPHTITYLIAILWAARGEQIMPLDVLAHDPSRRATSDPAWLAAARVRRRALYIANVCFGVSQADLARVSGMTAAAVSLAVNAVEDTRDDDDDSSLIGQIESVMNFAASGRKEAGRVEDR
ncbi:hypothetical protein LC092_05320 [Stappia stellulata]|uniref:hypothetical protein n=1 Tax=Stappia stellulata TaxID=71235 RepID=UPI001CD74474|nr:hypothetical protein [Stappia stellulata]MCA1241847.1 hypothetical protein [Stappia stellulata]